MVKAIVPPLHSVSIQFSLTCFFADGSTHYTLHLQACRHGWVGAFSSAPGFCCFPACLGDLSISLLADLPHSFERLPRTACKSSTGDSNA